MHQCYFSNYYSFWSYLKLDFIKFLIIIFLLLIFN